MDKRTSAKYSEILCIGAGLSGICLGVQLKRKYGFTDIHFYDRNEGHYGTGKANQYPDHTCDVPAFLYSFYFELNPNWSSLFPSRDEIKEYLEGVVTKYKLRPHMTFRTECESATWDDLRQTWTVHLHDLVTGEHYSHKCRILFSAVGVLVDPKYPNIHGSDSFEGPIIHTANWRNDIDLSNKDVVVIGNGCSGTQVVPSILPGSKSVTQFFNTPHWIAERENLNLTPAWRWAFRNLPLLTRAIRAYMFVAAESKWPMFLFNKSGSRTKEYGAQDSKAFIMREAPAKYRNLLIPDSEYTGTRRIIDNNAVYLRSTHSPNFHLTRDPILEIMSRGVRTPNKTYSADAIILATGFQTGSNLGSLRVEGRHGERLSDHWRKMGGPGAYNGTALHGYPNFMILYGPNATTDYNSVIFSIEAQVKYALKVIQPVIIGEASEFEVKDKAEKTWDNKVQAALQNKVWIKSNPWDVTKGGKNIALYPWSRIYFWWRATFPVWGDWQYKYTSLHARRMRKRRNFWLWMLGLGLSGFYVSQNYSLLEIHDMGKAMVWEIRLWFE